MSKIPIKQSKKINKKGFLKNPLFYSSQRKPRYFINGRFYFGLMSFILLGFVFFGSDALAQISYFKNTGILSDSLLNNNGGEDNNNPFFDPKKTIFLETPDLKIIQDEFVYAISTPRVLTTQTLGDIFGESSQEKKEVIDYTVQIGDTIESLAQQFGISANTIIWANDISKNATLKVGQNLTILPVSGLSHVVKSGDTISQISKTYKANADEIIVFNNLANEGDIFIGDILIIPNGTLPSKPVPSINAHFTDIFFIYPAEGKITQGLHWYNAVDVANKCGTPVHVVASGTVQRARYGWNAGGGNQVSVLHSGNIVTYYGHLMTIFVKPGDKVSVGDRIGLIGNNGISTGCHLHFGVTGAKNPLAKYSLGSVINYK